MKVLLRRESDAALFVDHGRWPKSRRDAHDFHTTLKALAVACTVHERTTIVLAFPDPTYDLYLSGGEGRIQIAAKDSRRIHSVTSSLSDYERSAAGLG